ncbi:MAG: class I SAM-dependent methyltransferase [Verrucomicrobia bacterium]|nr:class I SAM-dependent methyltransferase [Verrucomicrobiota bacterium]
MKLRQILRGIAANAPFAARCYRSARDRIMELRSAKSIFSHIYATRGWIDEESVSGPGSTLAQTANLRSELPGLLRRIHAKSMLDAPCGDFHWMKETTLPIDRYIGGDVVADLIRHHQDVFASETREFRQMDLLRDNLPAVDVILCRDCLVHLSFRRIRLALRNFKHSGSTYLLLTSFTAIPENRDIVTGGWRPLDFRLPPFNFPAPLEVISESTFDPNGQKHVQLLALWRLADLPEV